MASCEKHPEPGSNGPGLPLGGDLTDSWSPAVALVNAAQPYACGGAHFLRNAAISDGASFTLSSNSPFFCA